MVANVEPNVKSSNFKIAAQMAAIFFENVMIYVINGIWIFEVGAYDFNVTNLKLKMAGVAA